MTLRPSRRAVEMRWITLGWALLLLIVVSWPIRYVQQLAFGQVIIYTGLLRLTLFLAIFSWALLTASRETSRDQFRILAFGYLLVSLLVYNLMIVNFGAFYAAFGFNFFVIPPAIAFTFLLNARYFPVRDGPDERKVNHILLAVAVPVALYGILQYATNDAILQTGFAGVPKSEFGAAGQAMVRLTQLASTHRIRANSIFGSAIEFGNFAVLFAVLCCGMVLREWRYTWNRIVFALLAGVFVVAVLSTNTRNMVLFLGCCGIGCLLIWAGLSARMLIVAALALVALFYATIYSVVALAPGSFAGFFDSVSLYQRATGVYVTVNQFIVNADSLTHVLFGYGYMQSENFSFLPTTTFDNTGLDVYLYAGLCGVVLYLALVLVLFMFAVRQWRETQKVAWLAASSLMFGTPLFSTMNIDLDQPCFVFVFALVAGGATMPAVSAGFWRMARTPERPLGINTI